MIGSTTTPKRVTAAAGCIAAGIIVAACSMAESLHISPIGNHTCVSQGGTYYLSKSHLKVIVERVASVAADGKTAGPESYSLTGVTAEAKPDRAQLYCLDYNSSPTANDTLLISKTPANLLQTITSNADDRSAQIAEDLIKAVFVSISQNPGFDRTLSTRAARRLPPTGVSHLNLSFDPFEDAQVDVTNDALRHTGFCLKLERPDSGPRDINSYCDHPLGHDGREASLRETAETLGRYDPPVINGPLGANPSRARGADGPMSRAPRAMTKANAPVLTQGILYRPRVAHSLLLFVKRDLKARGGWELRSRATVLLENVSPTIAVGIDRAFFAKRKTTITFDDGVLRDIEIEKGSELLGFANIPLVIAQSITALPANIIQVRLQETNNRARLIDAQEKLLKSKRDLAELQGKITPATGPLTRSGNPFNSTRSAGDVVEERIGQGGNEGGDQAGFSGCVTQCTKPGDRSAQVCRNFCSCKASCTAQASNNDACNLYCTQSAN